MNPPVTRQIRVRCSAAHAFKVFTSRMDQWWPPRHRPFAGQGARVAVEPRVGGRFYATNAAGEVWEYGRVLRWEPPDCLSYAWFLGTSAELPTEVTVTFSPQGDETLVEVVHRESQSLGGAWPEKAVIYRRSWQAVMDAFAAQIEAGDTP